jgi:phenylpropionate dioxygenase-like ring-hydroxylating dioxygenase large terminal subunit
MATTYRAGPVIDRSLYTDREVYRTEEARIFEHAWLYVAHESELRNPGDFRTADLAGQPVLAVRGDDGKIRIVYNSCRHRGPLVEREAGGNRATFRCLYHNWEYGRDGRLVNVPRCEGQGPEFRLEDYPLASVARVESLYGLIFASLDSKVPPLSEYVGQAAPYLEQVALYDGKPQEVYGTYEYVYEGNWKLICENTVDDYHPQYLHAPTYQESQRRLGGLGISGAFMGGRSAADLEATRRSLDLGFHGFITWRAQDRNLHHQTARKDHLHISVFPSLLLLYDPIRDVTGIRVIKPEAVDRTRVVTACLGPADASEERRRGIAARFNQNWGPTGRVGPDDITCFEYIQKGLRAKAGGDVLMTRGLELGPLGGRAGDEQSVRAVWNGWRHFMMGEAS